MVAAPPIETVWSPPVNHLNEASITNAVLAAAIPVAERNASDVVVLGVTP